MKKKTDGSCVQYANEERTPTEKVSLYLQNPMAYLTVLKAGAVKKDTTNIDLSEIKEGMTLDQAFELLGSVFSDDRNSLYPIEYNWKLDGDRRLYIMFETEDYEEFRERLHNGEFALPDEAIVTDSLGIRDATPNEIKVLGEWLRNYRATSAYVIDGSYANKTVLFQKSDDVSGTLPDTSES